MNKTASRQRLFRWLPRLGLLFVLITVALATWNARTTAQELNACGSLLGQYPPLEGQTLSGHLDILSWNIQKASNEGWAEDLADMTQGVHLAFIQEASLQAKIPDVIPQDELYQAFTQGYTTSSLETGVMTLSNSTPSMLCNFTITEPWLGTPKAATVTEHPIEGRDERLLAINIHAVNFTFGVEDFRAQLQPLADLLAQHNGPAILAGDINTWSQSRQQLVDQLLSELGLAPLEFTQDLRTTVSGRPLDHIYIRGLEAESTEVIPVSTSDHNALRARLQLN